MTDKEERTSEEPLMLEDKIEDEDSQWIWSAEVRRPKPQRKLLFWFIIFVPWILLVLLGTWDLVQYRKRHAVAKFNPTQQIYSPAEDVIEYELVTFLSGHDDDGTPFVLEPSPELDEAWLSLYPSLWQLIDQEQAAQLVNPTILFPHDPDRRYVVELDVFHQLHCLNMIRQALRPDYYEPTNPAMINGHMEDTLLGPRHMKHCLNQIRQAIMCHGDVTPYVWQWNETLGYNQNLISTPHTCRNFDKIRDWARPENHGGIVEVGFDFKGREMNDPLDSRTWVNGYSGE